MLDLTAAASASASLPHHLTARFICLVVFQLREKLQSEIVEKCNVEMMVVSGVCNCGGPAVS